MFFSLRGVSIKTIQKKKATRQPRTDCLLGSTQHETCLPFLLLAACGGVRAKLGRGVCSSGDCRFFDPHFFLTSSKHTLLVQLHRRHLISSSPRLHNSHIEDILQWGIPDPWLQRNAAQVAAPSVWNWERDLHHDRFRDFLARPGRS